MKYPSLDVRATGERIRFLRVERHLRVEDIAIFMGFESPNAVYKWQRGECLPTVDNLYALSRLFETTIDDILIPMREEDERLPLIILHLSSYICLFFFIRILDILYSI